MTLEPGLIVLIYRRRWDIEKVYDEFKNKFHEPERNGDSQPLLLIIRWQKKAWASSPAAKSAQATFLCLTHNLTVLHDRALADAGVVNEAGIKRRAKRLRDQTTDAAKAGRVIPLIVSAFQRLTLRSVKFIRWLRQNLWSLRPLPDLRAILTKLYRTP